MNQDHDGDTRTFLVVIIGIGCLWVYNFYVTLSSFYSALYVAFLIVSFSLISAVYWKFFSKSGRQNQTRLAHIREIPQCLIEPSDSGVFMGDEVDLQLPVYLPDSIRKRHIHILGATGSGKTESVILNFLKQDVSRGLGSIVIDAKGDKSFLDSLLKWVPSNRLRVFDLTSENSLGYNPLFDGSPLESAQRLFSSLIWSEEYYASKARSVLQIIFQSHFRSKNRNPTLKELSIYLDSPKSYAKIATSESYPFKNAEQDFVAVSGLRDQINSLCTGHLANILSPSEKRISLADATKGIVLYFRLQTLMSPQIVTTVGKFLINHLNFLAGTAHRGDGLAKGANLIPTYVDEFAAFACPEFADLISKARSANIALHFSHQSIGDLQDVSNGFLNRITDNSATKIVLRINDPDSAEYMARAFGTKLYQKVTQRITNAKEIDTAEVTEEGSSREAHQFRASPDLLKTLPTGTASVLIAHGFDTPHGASSVLKIKFPKLKEE
jgi:conjugal transfer pilus assembly protein TraD